jgi:hypothetical protein
MFPRTAEPVPEKGAIVTGDRSYWIRRKNEGAIDLELVAEESAKPASNPKPARVPAGEKKD